MHEEDCFLQEIQAKPEDADIQMVYADWLEERGDTRSDFLRLELALRYLPPDHPHRVAGEQELSLLRKDLDRTWLTVVEPGRAALEADPRASRSCSCFDAGYTNRKWSKMDFHVEPQDTECAAWKQLLDLVEQAATDGRREFAPLREMSSATSAQIVTLPATISKLKSVKKLHLHGSHLLRIPPEIGQMTSLKEFDPYTSYRLHWFPYEITRCKNLRDSRVSTRALYGNFKYRPPFPQLEAYAGSPSSRVTTRVLAQRCVQKPIRLCSVCDRPFEDLGGHRVWISLRVATDGVHS